MEKWKAVVGYEGKYEVSSLGRVRSWPNGRLHIHKLSQNEKYKSWHLSLRLNGTKKLSSVHRMVANAFIPNPFNKPEVNHLDCDRSNNHLDNLEWATHKENMVHAGMMGRMSRDRRGRLNPSYKHGRCVKPNYRERFDRNRHVIKKAA